MKVELLQTSGKKFFGWVKYRINGLEFSSDTAPERVNALAWEHMDPYDKKQVIECVGFNRATQFGNASDEMGRWYDLQNGWKEGAEILTDSLIEKDYPGLTKQFGTLYRYTYREKNCTTEYDNAIGEIPELENLCNAREYLFELACSAYDTLENAEYIRTQAAVKSLSESLIKLICDKCFVPSITPTMSGGIGLLSAPDVVGTAIDYFNNITGLQDSMVTAVTGDGAPSDKARAVIDKATSAIEQSYSLIQSCKSKIDEINATIRNRYPNLLEKQEKLNAAILQEEQDIRDRNEARIVNITPNTAIYEIYCQLLETENSLFEIWYEKQIQYWNTQDESYYPAVEAAWNKYEAASRARSDYLSDTEADIESRLNAWREKYLGSDLKGGIFGALQKEYDEYERPLYPDGIPELGTLASFGSSASGHIEFRKYVNDLKLYYDFLRGLGRRLLDEANAAYNEGKSIYADYIGIRESSSELFYAWPDRPEESDFYDVFDACYYVADFAWRKSVEYSNEERINMDYDMRRILAEAGMRETYSQIYNARERLKSDAKTFLSNHIDAMNANKALCDQESSNFAAFESAMPAYITQEMLDDYYRLVPLPDTELGQTFTDDRGTIDIGKIYQEELNEKMRRYRQIEEDSRRFNSLYWLHRDMLENCGWRVTHWSGVEYDTTAVPDFVNPGESTMKMISLRHDFNGNTEAQVRLLIIYGSISKIAVSAATSLDDAVSYSYAALKTAAEAYAPPPSIRKRAAGRPLLGSVIDDYYNYDHSGGSYCVNSYAAHIPGYVKSVAGVEVYEDLVKPLIDSIDAARARLEESGRTWDCAGYGTVEENGEVGYTITAIDDQVLTEDSIQFGLSETKGAYNVEIAADGRSATITLKPPVAGVAQFAEVVEEDPEDDSGLLASIEDIETKYGEGAVKAKPEPMPWEIEKGNDEVGALPVKTYPGLWYQARWGDDISSLLPGEKVQADGDTLYLGVIKQKGGKGFYGLSVSEE